MKLLNDRQVKELKNFLYDQEECPVWLEEFATMQWADCIPYGTLTGDEDTMDQWLSDHADWVEDEFSEYLE